VLKEYPTAENMISLVTYCNGRKVHAPQTHQSVL